MKSVFVLLFLLVVPFVACNDLRFEPKAAAIPNPDLLSVSPTVKKSEVSMKTVAPGSTFPTSPQYVIAQIFALADTSCSNVLSLKSFLVGTCVSSGTGSAKLTCGK